MKMNVTAHPWVSPEEFQIDLPEFSGGVILRIGAICEQFELYLTQPQAAALRDAITAHLEAVQYVACHPAIPSESLPQAESYTDEFPPQRPPDQIDDDTPF